MTEIITVQEAADLIGCTREYVYYLIKTGDKYGKIKAVKPGRDWQVSRQSVEIYKQTRDETTSYKHGD